MTTRYHLESHASSNRHVRIERLTDLISSQWVGGLVSTKTGRLVRFGSSYGLHRTDSHAVRRCRRKAARAARKANR